MSPSPSSSRSSGQGLLVIGEREETADDDDNNNNNEKKRAKEKTEKEKEETPWIRYNHHRRQNVSSDDDDDDDDGNNDTMTISSSSFRRSYCCFSLMRTMKINIVSAVAAWIVMMMAASSPPLARFAAGFTITTSNYLFKSHLQESITRSTNGCLLSSIQQSQSSSILGSETSFRSRRNPIGTVTTLRALPNNYQQYGEEIIRQAAYKSCGINLDDTETLQIEWKPGKIIVTVYSDETYVSVDMDDGDSGDGDDADDESLDASDNNDTQHLDSSQSSRGVDVTALARAINEALDDSDGEEGGGVGLAIAEAHEIEVTTPGAPDELTGIMWESYRGFEVICQFMDPKTKKTKTIEGRLHERNDEFTVINIKGRMKKLKNDSVVSVKLPKAKREKGVS